MHGHMHMQARLGPNCCLRASARPSPSHSETHSPPTHYSSVRCASLCRMRRIPCRAECGDRGQMSTLRPTAYHISAAISLYVFFRPYWVQWTGDSNAMLIKMYSSLYFE